MTYELEPMKQRRPELPPALPPFSKEARQVAQMDRQSIVRAREDFNRVREHLHQLELSRLAENAEADMREECTIHAMRNAREVDDAARHFEGGREGLAMTIREMQAAYNTGEIAHIAMRGCHR
ncbi:hypothetical protein [Mycobacterium sp. UM_CSW]|uniref:hypothetical protein n=1 Tax=Mycobacterium sp. UM_CSW TaxID=1370119 RepID=UPI00082B8514|nr:hypothetical protein [Mycobacterium sp. UM_CSW]